MSKYVDRKLNNNNNELQMNPLQQSVRIINEAQSNLNKYIIIP